METQVLEGTLAEIQRQLERLPEDAERRFRVTLEEAPEEMTGKRKLNGITLVPVKDPTREVTTAMIKDLLEAE
jgi:TRAP-type C4-dicarboxylate transport system substrate-binding protein